MGVQILPGRFQDGSAVLPAKGYILDPTLGQYRIGSNNEGFAAGGALRWDYNTTRINSTIPIYGPDGSATAPPFAFSTEPGMGPYRFGAAQYALAITGAMRHYWGPTLYWLNSDSAEIHLGAGEDVKLARDAANVLAQRNGTNAQNFNVYNTISGADKEYLSIGWSGNSVFLHTIASGAGVNRDLAIGTNGAGDLYLRRAGSNTWKVAAVGGHFTGLSATAGLGYGTGAGGTVTQATSKATGVTLNTVTGQITMNAAALAAAAKVSFVVTDSAFALTDVAVPCVVSGGTANAYRVSHTASAAGSFTLTVENITAGSLSEAPVIGFVIVKGVTS